MAREGVIFEILVVAKKVGRDLRPSDLTYVAPRKTNVKLATGCIMNWLRCIEALIDKSLCSKDLRR